MFKKINAWVHLWFGLVSGIIVLVLSLTGCILVFELEIKSLTSPWLHADAAGREMLPPSRMYQAAQDALPDKTVRSVWYYGEGRTAAVSLTKSDSTVFVNPYNAEVVAIKNHEDFFDFIKDGHYYLWFPEKIGHQITAWGTAVFFVLLVSGIILWWPKKWNKRSVDQSFKVKWKAKFKRVNYDLHNVLGFYSLLIALVLAFTGLMMGFRWVNNTVFKLAGGNEKVERIKALSDTLNITQINRYAQADKAWKLGITQIGEHNKKDIIVALPTKQSDPIYICVDMYKGDWRDVYLDQYTLKQLPASNSRLRDVDIANWIRRSNYGLHVGAIGGLTTKIIYFIASFICASLPVTGFYIWWGRRKPKKVRPARSVLASTPV